MPIEFQVLIATTAIGLAGWLGGSLLKVLREIRDELIALKLTTHTHRQELEGVQDKLGEHHERFEKHEKRLLRLEAKN